eukprot:2766888-Prymnesium_polylepis.1
MVGHILSSVVHRVAEAASMAALHNMRAQAASSPTRPWCFRSAMMVFLDRLHDFVGAWAVGTGHFPYGGA